ncbi:MAG: OmpA family protein [Bacteroidales bacterium]|nr:OmpA family protein [Bacteroidales bacterium]
MNIKIFFILILFLASCVPQKEFRKVQREKEQLQALNDSLKERNRKLEISNRELGTRVKVLENRIERLVRDSMKRAERLVNYRQENERLRDQYDDLKENQEKILKGTNEETKKLLSEIQSTQGKLQQKEDRLEELEENLASERDHLNELETELNKKSERLVELERALNEKDSVVNALRDKVSDALYGFEGEGLDVKIKNGKVYVSMEDKLLFPSGSTQIDQRGKEALKKLSQVLERNKDINIMVEGHTDNVPVRKNPSFQDNWDLSVKRATAVIRVLMNNSNIQGERFIAAGKSKYLPLESNETEQGRRINRRTEIILTPKLGELLEILNMN